MIAPRPPATLQAVRASRQLAVESQPKLRANAVSIVCAAIVVGHADRRKRAGEQL